MNMKRNLRALVFLGGLLMVIWAYAQTAISTDGIVESTSGGFKFPDGTVQTSAAAPSATITEYRIVGLTTATTDGTAVATVGASNDEVNGLSAMDILCETEFGPESRVAFTNEQLAPSVSPFTDQGWIRPSNIGILYNPDATQGNPWTAYDTVVGVIGFSRSSQISAVEHLNCEGFNSTTGAGIVIKPITGTFETRFCEDFVRIACSAPVQITTTP